eukprot:m.59192 g.59192  ORF g.59192 m.59192 type:complete len:400 (-) comp11756_c1_seq2:1657-2856(-)
MSEKWRKVRTTLFEESNDLINLGIRKGILCHEINLGGQCFKCGDACPGFELHFWRKCCRHCKCSPFSHKSDDDEAVQDGPSRRVGKLSEALRSQFISRPQGIASGGTSPMSRGVNASSGPDSSVPVAQEEGPLLYEVVKIGERMMPTLTPDLEFAWKPDGLTQAEAVDFFAAPFPIAQVPVANTDGERRFFMSLEEQVPSHDMDASRCDALSGIEQQEFSALLQLKVDNHELAQVSRAKMAAPCFACREPMVVGKMQVTIQGMPGVRYHPYCFRCTTCKELLVGLNAWIKDDSIFCERHFSDCYKARCAACDESICEAQVLQAEGKHWHVKHFCCFLCDKPCGDEPYIPLDGQPHCPNCFHKKVGGRERLTIRKKRQPGDKPIVPSADPDAPPPLPPRK